MSKIVMGMVSSNFKIIIKSKLIMQAPGHNHENTLFQLGQYLFNIYQKSRAHP